MKKFVSLFLALVLVLVPFVFVGCAQDNSIKLEGGPKAEDTVSGNGSFAVRKGEYIYFASGYVASSDVGSAGITNNLGEVQNGAIYRAKVESTKISIENKDKETEEVDSLKLSDAVMLVSKIAGFENSGLYIFGNKLYFATPSTSKNSSGSTLSSLLSFYSVDLDGQNLKEFYQTPEYSSGSYSFIKIENSVYLLVNTGKQIVRVSTNGETKVLASDIKSAFLPKSDVLVNNQYNILSNENFVYYTVASEKTTDDRDYGTCLYKANITTGEATKLLAIDYVTITVVKLENNVLFYTRNEVLAGASTTEGSYLYSNDLSGDFAAGEKKFSFQTTISKVFNFKSGETEGYVYVNNGQLIFKDKEGNPTVLSSSASSIVGIMGKYVYYVGSSSLYRVDVTSEKPSSNLEKLSSSSTINTSYIDLDSDFAFIFVKDSDKNIYETHYIDLKYFIKDTTEPVKAVA